MPMPCIWNQAKDDHISHYLAYVNANNIACSDPEGQYPIKAGTLKDLFLKSMLIIDNDVAYTPLSMTEGELVVDIVYVKLNSSNQPVFCTVTGIEPVLKSLSVGNKVLTPSFTSDVFAYAVTTTDVSNVVAAVGLPESAVISATLNSVEVEDLETALMWETGENILVITVTSGEESVIYTITVTKESAPNPLLTSLSVGTETLVPEFSSAVTEYAVDTTETSELLAFVASPLEATVVVTLNSVPVLAEDLDEPLVLTAGPDVIVITVIEGAVDKAYTITVTQGA